MSDGGGNPNPARITAAMWRLWTDRPVSSWRLGGIYANKPGYHSSRQENQAKWPGNYSIRLSLDKQGPADKAAAIDYTMSDAEIRKRSAYLLDACNRRDPRLAAVREWYGTVDGRAVIGRIKDSRDGSWRASTSDSSHLWHIHISFFRAYIDKWGELAPVLSVLAGERLETWQSKQKEVPDEVSFVGLRKDTSIKDPRVGELQLMLAEMGYMTRGDQNRNIDDIFGPMTEGAIVKLLRDEGSGITKVDRIDRWVSFYIRRAWGKHCARKVLGGVDVEKRLAAYVDANREKLRGPKGDPGPQGPKGPPGEAPPIIRVSGTLTVEG